MMIATTITKEKVMASGILKFVSSDPAEFGGGVE